MMSNFPSSNSISRTSPCTAVARTCGAAAATRCAARSSIGRLKSTSVTPRSDGIRPISFSE
jgi:hypothetical protein